MGPSYSFQDIMLQIGRSPLEPIANLAALIDRAAHEDLKLLSQVPAKPPEIIPHIVVNVVCDAPKESEGDRIMRITRELANG